MPRRLIRRFTPDHKTVREHKYLQVFGDLLHDPNLFHLNRRSVSGAFFIGLFWAFMPTPLQMLWSALFAIVIRVNLPIAVSLVWVTNPVTIPPMFYGAYALGAWLLGEEASMQSFELSWSWLTSVFVHIWQPLLLGSTICGLITGLMGYVAIRAYWRWHVVARWEERRAHRLDTQPSDS